MLFFIVLDMHTFVRELYFWGPLFANSPAFHVVFTVFGHGLNIPKHFSWDCWNVPNVKLSWFRRVSFLQCQIKRNATTGLYLTVLLLLGNPRAPLEFLFFLRSTPLTTFSFNWRQLTYERKTISALNTLFAVCQGRIAHRLACLVALLWYKNRVNISFELLSVFNWRT